MQVIPCDNPRKVPGAEFIQDAPPMTSAIGLTPTNPPLLMPWLLSIVHDSVRCIIQKHFSAISSVSLVASF
jgi:hypothetical protein